MWTREDYLESRCFHREYYAEFVDEPLIRSVRKELLSSIVNSKDPCFNDIPLRVWDQISWLVKNEKIRKALKERGDFLTSAGGICILKEAARQIKEEVKSWRNPTD